MGNTRKFKTLITILVILILILYISGSSGIFIAFLTASLNVELILTHLIALLNYIGFEFNTTIALLIIPASILLLINIKNIDLDKRYTICQILSFVSFLLILLSIFIPFLIYLTWLEDQPGMDIQVWGTIIPIFMIYLVELVLDLLVFILLTIKHD